MKKSSFIPLTILLGLCGSAIAQNQPRVRRTETVVITPYKTTIIADGKDVAHITVSVQDRQGNLIPGATNVIHFKLTGDAKIISIGNENDPPHMPDTGLNEAVYKGQLKLVLQAGTTRSILKLTATSDTLSTAASEIHTVQPGTPHPVTSGAPIAGTAKITDKVIGADISFLPQNEDRGIKYYDSKGQPGDALQILKDHGFNYIRLRIFHHPAIAKGYSPGKGFCDLPHTMAMAKRIKASGMKFLLDIHYSDTWADPQRQNTPEAWAGLDFATVKDSVFTYTKMIMQALKSQGTEPDMVQVGNEINHGMIWPDGAINNLDTLAGFIYQGVRGVKAVSPNAIIMLHIALGGQNEEARFFVGNMVKRNVPFDVIGLSYYPQYHGTPGDLKNNMADLAKRYHKYVMVAEYSQHRAQVNDIAFTAPGDKAVGTFIWEPLNLFFDRSGKPTPVLEEYPPIAAKYVH
jgi:arabinogalactan endo-1,4-beta-galactosidase